MKKTLLLFAGLWLLAASCTRTETRYDLADYGIEPDTRENTSPLFEKAIRQILSEAPAGSPIVITLKKGRYDFLPDSSAVREYYISNHDQDNPKQVGLPFENVKNLVFDGQESELVFHGRMLPVSVVGAENCTLKNFSIDFETPHIAQVKVLENDPEAGTLTFETAPWVRYSIRDGKFYHAGEGWEISPSWGIAFEDSTKRLVFNTSDIGLGTGDVTEIAPRIIRSNKWKNPKLVPGTVIAMRSYQRPTPGIFVDGGKDIALRNIRIHYAEGMGVLAQLTENIELDSLSVCLRGKDDPRYFTTQADATHFSGCKGTIVSKNGLYEGMMDDAINVHGTYLKVIRRIDDRTLQGRYMHGQSYGFEWGEPGDTVQFIDAGTMEIAGNPNRIASIRAVDKPSEKGAKVFEIVFTDPVDPAIDTTRTFGMENLSWTPAVVFTDNTIRNNRARGALFSTPKPVIVKKNLFDHTSGTAILLCGDCNGWFETGACRDVTISENRFVNALTSQFQFTNAVISVYPEIPDLAGQKQYFHSGIRIENNTFETFDAPLLYAKSVDGISFTNNTVTHNRDYPAFHWNRNPFFFQRVKNFRIEDNRFDTGFDLSKDLRLEE